MLLVARLEIAVVTLAGVLYLAGSLAMRVRARPATWGEAIEVPLMVFVPLLPGWIQALVMLRPGAKRSRAVYSR